MNTHTDTPRSPAAEFDAYSGEYAAGMENPVKSLLGESADDFVAIKLRWLLRRFPNLARAGAEFRILDYGCGIATLLRLVAESRVGATLLGCDISAGMLDEARQRWPAALRPPELHQQEGAHVALPDASVNLVIISAVLHHVPPRERSAVYAELHRLLRPGGTLVVFEHNPLNPVTRYVVARTPIDANAILLRAREVCGAVTVQLFADVRTSYLMFAPPRLTALSALEHHLGWLPLGAQYAVTAVRR